MHAPAICDLGAFEIRFESLFDGGRALAFPCDACGRVDLDTMPPKARSNYLYARALVGRDYAMPRIEPSMTSLSDASRKFQSACPCS